jgi:hypothetical protein
MYGKIIILILIPLLIVNCNNQPEAKEVISMEDFAGEFGGDSSYYAQPIQENGLNFQIKSPKIDSLLKPLLKNCNVQQNEQPQIIDRFGYELRDKISLQGPARDSIRSKHAFYYYEFSDSTKTKNALYNWMDCFGETCEMIARNEPKKRVAGQPMQVFVFEKDILIWEYDCNSYDQLNEIILEDINKVFTVNPLHHIEVNCLQEIIWE